MGTGKQINDKFYKGYEGEEEIVFETDGNHESLHVWGGYLDDILEEPFEDNDWKGLTRDYQECINAYSDDSDEGLLDDLKEYIDDLKQYCGREFSFEETGDCLSIIISFLENAEQQSCKVTMREM